MNRAARTLAVRAKRAAKLETKMLGKGPGSSKLKAQFSKARRGLNAAPGRGGAVAFGLQGRLKRAETYLAARAKKQPKAVASRNKRTAKRAADEASRSAALHALRVDRIGFLHDYMRGPS